MMNRTRVISWIVSMLLLLGSGHVSAYGNAGSAPNRDAIPHTASVLEAISTAGYTYIRVEESSSVYWIAVPETQVEVGEKISFYEQMLMEDFTSKTLNRTFDRILFVEAISKGETLPTKAHAQPSKNKQPPKPVAAPQPAVELGDPVGRFTVEQIFEKKQELSGSVIEVKGKVSKVSSQIMGRDWVHLEDGSGSKQAKNHKIILRTTQAGISVGDEVVAKGQLFTNKDFGYGYFYPVILEDVVFNK
ncbi:MAG: hypothetical protein N0C84_19020 [Candidatus Thiodiazotropha taylori]|uniref:DNA-binding protein n=1 Tax=Candidatus Thiodiazotropha taylori TaxID=2792791 RepID=A0A9E4N6I0_9GAMM|nr:hypothetical protein [Candidatus Thiodiazotropha taylori]MCW4258559.1 hypothetical protein [Candidatus Thiodiazotropha taylori]